MRSQLHSFLFGSINKILIMLNDKDEYRVETSRLRKNFDEMSQLYFIFYIKKLSRRVSLENGQTGFGKYRKNSILR